MKIKHCGILLFLSVLFIPTLTNAKIIDNTSCRDQDESITTCEFKFTSSEEMTSFNTIQIKLILENVTLESITLQEGWYLKEQTNNSISIETSKDHLEPNFSIGTATFKRIKWAEDCHISADFHFDKDARSCTFFKGNYYDANGKITNEISYQKECEKPVCHVYPDGTYSDKKGNLVSQLVYEKECEKLVCHVYPDGTYSDKKGNLVSQLVYEKECEKPVCHIYPDGTYSDKKGNLVSQLVYEKECEKPVCHVYPDGTYSDKKGNLVSQLVYEKECEKPVCHVYPDGTYSDKKGNLVSQLDYEKECKKPVCHVYPDGTYSDKNGNLVSQLVYEKECTTTTYSCKMIDQIKYGLNGNIVDDITYQKECEKPTCHVYSDGTYSDNQGNIVDRKEYDSSCSQMVENPKTGSFISYLLLGAASLIALICYITAKKAKIYNL